MDIIDEYYSESGKFLCVNGIARSFEPATSNIVEEDIKKVGDVHYTVKTLIVPFGVIGFASNFCRGMTVQDIFILPDTLESIGDDCENGCVFANTNLPEVFIPESVRMIGTFAFGGSKIKKLVIRAKTYSPYLRQFKDSTIGKIYLPSRHINASQNGYWLEGHGYYPDKYGFYRNFYMHCRCEIVEY